ncbi:MAG: redoxin domain-containing protein [Gammaproteobacteria bacterium]|nr:redoxin domain-containing protein [Gammaproteobacteria bacterium]
MKIFSVILVILLFTTLQACSDQEETSASKSNNTPTSNPVNQSVSKVIEPQGLIKNSVLDELQEGRWELVMFWATYCHICKSDFEKLAEFIQDNPSIPLTVVGVVTDGLEEKQKALRQIQERNLNYTHVLTDFDHSNVLYQDITQSTLIGVPSQLLYNTENKLAGYSRNAIDIDALELLVYE